VGGRLLSVINLDEHFSKAMPFKKTYCLSNGARVVAMARCPNRGQLHGYGRAEISFGNGFLYDIALSLDVLL
jgi:hypothetical protein